MEMHRLRPVIWSLLGGAHGQITPVFLSRCPGTVFVQNWIGLVGPICPLKSSDNDWDNHAMSSVQVYLEPF